MAKQAIDELAIIISADASKLAPDLNKAKKDFAKFSRDVEGAGARPPKPPDMRAHHKAAQDAASARNSVMAAGESVLGFAAKVAVTGGSILALEAGITGVAGAFGQLRDSVRMAAELEQTRLGFEVMLGDAREATRLVADVRQYAAATPFNTRELTGATRQLVAYGRSADTAMQDLKMLGDVSAAFGDSLPIGELVYLYGTLYAQQRAFTKDLYQFAGRGIPIWEELARVTGKTGVELREMVEDGRIGFTEVEAAFRRMTGEGGRFNGMTARQGQTVAGVLEQMKDGFELLKIEVGQVLIEELGIKQGAKDLEAFAAKLRENVGVLRPAVKLIGDLAKGAVQVGYEFGKAAIKVASLNLDSYANALPGLQQIGETIRRLITESGDFKLDEKAVIDFAFSFGRAMVTNVVSIGQHVGTFGDGMLGLFEWIVKSAREARDYMQETARWLTRINDAVQPAMRFLVPGAMLNDVINHAQRAFQQDAAQARQAGAPIDPFTVAPPGPGMTADRMRDEWQTMSATVNRLVAQAEVERGEVAAGRLPALLLRQTEQRLADVRRNMETYLGGFEGDPAAVRRHLNSGDVPIVRRNAPVAGPVTPPADDSLAQLQQGLAAARGPFQRLRDLRADGINAEIEQGHARALADLEARRSAERAAAEAELHNQALRAAVFGMTGRWPTPPDPTAERDANRRGAVNAALGGPLGLFHGGAPPIPPDIQALVSDIRRQYDPRRELDTYRAQLDQIQSRGLLGDNTTAFVNRAWRDKLTEVGGKLGIEHGRYQLPEATAVGSAEDARMITAWRTEGMRPATTDSLLQQILGVVQSQLAIEQQRGGSFPVPPIPKIVKLPGE